MSITRGRIVDYTDGDSQVWPAIVVSVDADNENTVTLFVIYEAETDHVHHVEHSQYNAGHGSSKYKWQWPKRVEGQ